MDDMYDFYGSPQFPELYYRLYPMVEDNVNRYLKENPAGPDLTDEQVQGIVDEIFERLVRECPEIAEDIDEKNNRHAMDVEAQQRPFYGRRRLSRDLISIILLSRLFGRRGRRRYPDYDFRGGFGYPGYGYPGYGYPGYGYPGYGYPGY